MGAKVGLAKGETAMVDKLWRAMTCYTMKGPNTQNRSRLFTLSFCVCVQQQASVPGLICVSVFTNAFVYTAFQGSSKALIFHQICVIVICLTMFDSDSRHYTYPNKSCFFFLIFPHNVLNEFQLIFKFMKCKDKKKLYFIKSPSI